MASHLVFSIFSISCSLLEHAKLLEAIPGRFCLLITLSRETDPFVKFNTSLLFPDIRNCMWMLKRTRLVPGWEYYVHCTSELAQGGLSWHSLRPITALLAGILYTMSYSE